jgi:hypothetical protein
VTVRYGVNREREEVIREILRDNPDRSDRSIARQLGIHHSLPNRIRHELETEVEDGNEALRPIDAADQAIAALLESCELLQDRCVALEARCETAERQRRELTDDLMAKIRQLEGNLAES